VCQTLRIISFTVTQLPAPNYHCRIPELTAIKPMPEHWWGHFYIQNIAKQVRKPELRLHLRTVRAHWLHTLRVFSPGVCLSVRCYEA